MTSPTATVRRLRRAVGVTAVLVLTAFGGHAVGGGAMPPADVLAVVAMAMLPLGAVVVEGRVGRRGVLLLVSASQYAAHHVLTAAATSAARSGAAAEVCAARGPHPDQTACAPDVLAVHPVAHSAVLTIDGRMTLAHAAATLAAVALLSQGDRLVGAVRRALLPLRHRRAVALVPSGRPVAMPAGDRDVPQPVGVCVRTLPRRGPPIRRAAVTSLPR